MIIYTDCTTRIRQHLCFIFFQLAANKADLMVLEEEVQVLTKQKGTRIQ